jgi:hypothetical protein
MMRVNAQAFYSTSADLQVMRQMILDHERGGADLNGLLTPDDAVVVLGLSRSLAREVESLGAKVALVAIRRIENGAASAKFTYFDVLNITVDVNNRLRDELEGRTLLCLNDLEAVYLDPKLTPEMEAFLRAFPSAKFDADECMKCFAVERYTASVFHGLRVMEIGIRAFASCLGIPDPLSQRNWGAILKSLKPEIESRWSAAERIGGDGALFEELYSTLDAVRNPVRNATMHPQQTYTMNEAYDITRAISRFMLKLASRCDESGRPRLRRKPKVAAR